MDRAKILGLRGQTLHSGKAKKILPWEQIKNKKFLK